MDFPDLPDIDIDISTSGSTEVDQKLNITCTVILVEGLVGNLTVNWTKTDDLTEVDNLDDLQVRTSDGAVTNSTLVLDPVVFDYRGVYTCVAIFNTSFTNDDATSSKDHELVVDSKFCVTKCILQS